MSDEPPYAVGYGKPPVHGQFQKGRSGNPTGRPKGSHKPSAVLNKVANSKVTITEGGKRKKVSALEAMLMKTFQAAMTGDAKARGDILRLYGPQIIGDAKDDAAQEMMVRLGLQP